MRRTIWLATAGLLGCMGGDPGLESASGRTATTNYDLSTWTDQTGQSVVLWGPLAKETLALAIRAYPYPYHDEIRLDFATIYRFSEDLDMKDLGGSDEVVCIERTW